MKIALVGIGKIALDQHVPAIAASPDWELAATVSRSGRVADVPALLSQTKMLPVVTSLLRGCMILVSSSLLMSSATSLAPGK